MRDALTELLYRRYPTLFAEHRLDVAESGMAWGFQHDDGWFAIVDALASVVTKHLPGAAAAQVKQKMGALRFYLHGGDAFTHGACAAAELFSRTISEVSGRCGVLMVGRQGRWLKTLAPGELGGYVPVPSKPPGTGAARLADSKICAAPQSDTPQPQTVGAQAFHQAIAPRLHPITGDCGPVDDQGFMATDEAGK
jgi:hypothetical protein